MAIKGYYSLDEGPRHAPEERVEEKLRVDILGGVKGVPVIYWGVSKNRTDKRTGVVGAPGVRSDYAETMLKTMFRKWGKK